MLSVELWIDLISVLVSCGIAFLFCSPRHSHPFIAYLLFHVVFFSLRLIAIAGGDPTLFASWGPGYEPVTIEEISRAATLADFGLLAIAIGCALAALRSTAAASVDTGDPEVQTLSAAHVNRVCTITLPVGLVAFLYLTRNPFVEFQRSSGDEFQLSSAVTTLQTWMGLSLIALIYVNGFQKRFLLPLLIYLGVMMMQGYHRFRVIIPVIFLAQVWLDRSNRRWPSLPIVGLMLSLFFISVPLKGIGRMIQRGESIDSVASFAYDEVSRMFESQDTNQEFFDQFACTVALTDRAEYMAWGSTYLPLLTLPIPRALWPEKPGLGDHFNEITTSSRPMARCGMISTLLGESYMNFGLLGVIIVPAICGYILTRLYESAYRHPYYSVSRFAFIIVSCNLIQVYRDGLSSLFIFTLLNMMPLCLIVALHVIRPFSAFAPFDDWSERLVRPAGHSLRRRG